MGANALFAPIIHPGTLAAMPPIPSAITPYAGSSPACVATAILMRCSAIACLRAYRAATSPPLPADRLELPSQTRPPTVESGQMSPYHQDVAGCGLSSLSGLL